MDTEAPGQDRAHRLHCVSRRNPAGSEKILRGNTPSMLLKTSTNSLIPHAGLDSKQDGGAVR